MRGCSIVRILPLRPPGQRSGPRPFSFSGLAGQTNDARSLHRVFAATISMTLRFGLFVSRSPPLLAPSFPEEESIPRCQSYQNAWTPPLRVLAPFRADALGISKTNLALLGTRRRISIRMRVCKCQQGHHGRLARLRHTPTAISWRIGGTTPINAPRAGRLRQLDHFRVRPRSLHAERPKKQEFLLDSAPFVLYILYRQKQEKCLDQPDSRNRRVHPALG